MLAAAVSVTSLSFGSETVNTTIPSKAIGFGNEQSNVSLSISSITASAGFTVTGGTCSNSTTLAGGGNCTVLVAFASTASGAQTGTLTLTAQHQ